MRTAVDVGGSQTLKLHHALMIYSAGPASTWGEDRSDAYVTLHDAEQPAEGPPRLSPGRPADLDFLRTLSNSLQASVPPKILPAHVLVRTPDTIAWWSKRGVRPMFFREGTDLEPVSGKPFPHPPLVWAIIGQHMYVRALRKNARPGPESPLYHAPYWNVNRQGRVCLGSMKRPGEVSAAGLQEWEDGFFGSLFTGSIGGADVDWRPLAGKKSFPTKQLTPTKETLEGFVRGGGNA